MHISFKIYAIQMKISIKWKIRWTNHLLDPAVKWYELLFSLKCLYYISIISAIVASFFYAFYSFGLIKSNAMTLILSQWIRLLIILFVLKISKLWGQMVKRQSSQLFTELILKYFECGTIDFDLPVRSIDTMNRCFTLTNQNI